MSQENRPLCPMRLEKVKCGVCTSSNIKWEKPDIALFEEYGYITPGNNTQGYKEVSEHTDYSNIYFSGVCILYNGVCKCGAKQDAKFYSNFGKSFYKFNWSTGGDGKIILDLTKGLPGEQKTRIEKSDQVDRIEALNKKIKANCEKMKQPHKTEVVPPPPPSPPPNRIIKEDREPTPQNTYPPSPPPPPPHRIVKEGGREPKQMEPRLYLNSKGLIWNQDGNQKWVGKCPVCGQEYLGVKNNCICDMCNKGYVEMINTNKKATMKDILPLRKEIENLKVEINNLKERKP